jgi:aspartyl-tRNA(Asn)/glutamyl-tRNA(Gln) amidotransferase subunit C
MAIDAKTVLHIARLAYLELPRIQDKDGRWVDPPDRLMSDAELEKHAKDLGAILEHVKQLDALDTRGVEPTRHGVPLPPLLREDAVGEMLDTERALAGAPKRSGDAFSVPKVIE